MELDLWLSLNYVLRDLKESFGYVRYINLNLETIEPIANKNQSMYFFTNLENLKNEFE